MTSIRKFWWAGITLAAFVGCAEEPSATAPGPAATPAGPGPAPSTPPTASPTTSDSDKGEMKKEEAKPAPAETEKTEAAPKVEAPKPDAPKTEGDTKGASATLTDDQIAEIKKLPADEQALALKQIVCPVSGENLGDMGVPVKVSAEGKSFFLCCKGCKKDLDADAKSVVAKLKN